MSISSAISANLLIAAMLAGTPDPAEGADGLKAWLERVPAGDIVEFQGFVSAPEPMLVRYRLSILRISSGGRARTAQGGQVEIREPNQPTSLSVTAINVGKNDSYEVELVAIGDNGEEVRFELTRRPEDAQ